VGSTPAAFDAPTPTAVLVSGGGRSLENLLARERAGTLPTRIDLVVASRPGIAAIERAERRGVPTRAPPPDDLGPAFEAAGIQLVVMAGYLRHWPLPPQFEGRTINIHPALLPLFGGRGYYGDRVHRAVLESGMRVSGATVHFVTEAYDEGPIIVQQAVPVRPEDSVATLARRVFEVECELLPRAIEDLIAGRVWMESGRTRYAP